MKLNLLNANLLTPRLRGGADACGAAAGLAMLAAASGVLMTMNGAPPGAPMS